MIFDRLLFCLKIFQSEKKSQLISLGVNVIVGCLSDSIRDFVLNWKAGTDRILIWFQTIADPLARL
jgi:hypothetical protein